MSELIGEFYVLWGGRGEVLVVLGLFLAVVVTVHALLNKRDVASAIGWIGLAWFAPVMGSMTYIVFGINRVRNRARALRPRGRGPDLALGARATRVDSHLDPLARGIGGITGRTALPGNRVTVLQNGDAAYPPMLAAIEAARHSVGLSSYIFENDECGGRFIEALAAAQARGVAVRVLIDGFGGGWLLGRAHRRLRRRGVPAARFLHSLLPWRMPFINLRSHKKVLVVDGRVGFTGGMNIADENVAAMGAAEPVQDTHFRVEGPVVGQLTEAFLRDWAYAAGRAAGWGRVVSGAGAGGCGDRAGDRLGAGRGHGEDRVRRAAGAVLRAATGWRS